ncbi:hypothetical protein LguiB_033622 [Lonicera macranthoides]
MAFSLFPWIYFSLERKVIEIYIYRERCERSCVGYIFTFFFKKKWRWQEKMVVTVGINGVVGMEKLKRELVKN